MANADFLKLWAGQTISEIGSRISREGLPMTAVLVLQASPFQMGLLAAAGGAAVLIAGPAAGVVADRWRRRPILIAADAGRALVLGLIPLAAWMGWLSLPLLLAVAVTAGILTVFFDVAYQSYVPSLVKPEQLVGANSRLAVSASTAEVLGPGLTGVLVQWITAPGAILFDAASFLISAGSIAWIRRGEVHTPTETEPVGDAVAGLRYVAGHRVLRALALRAGTVSIFFGFFSTLYVLFALQTLGLPPAAMGAVIAVGGVSNLAGALAAQRVRWRAGRILIAASLIYGAFGALVPLASGSWQTAALMLAIAQLGDFAYPIFSVHELTLRQSTTAPEYLGRVNACMQMLYKGLWPVGALGGGALASAIGVRPTLAIAAAGVMASALLLWPIRNAEHRHRRDSDEH